MSMFDNLKDKAADLADKAKDGLEHVKDNVEGISDAAIEKVGDAADALTGGRFADQIDTAQAKADELIHGDEPTQQV